MRIVALIVVLLAVPAHAQPADPRTSNTGYIGKEIQPLEIDDCPVLPPMTQDQVRQVGGEHFDRGEVLYVQGDYKGAVKELVAAYCMIPFYSILKDIGQSYERELDYEKAIAYLERFVHAVPPDAKRASACDPDPQDEKATVIARIKVLQNLKAKVLVETSPGGARITMLDGNGVEQARGVSGDTIEIAGGHYTMVIERDGYFTSTRDLVANIGKPYTYFENLRPILGHLKVSVTPADARLYLNKNSIGQGEYEGDLMPGEEYTLTAEAPGFMTISRIVKILPDKPTELSFELPPEPQVGRRQLIGYSTGAGMVAGALVAGASDNPSVVFGGALAGLAAGAAVVYYGTPHDIALGTSSLTITSSLIGGVAGVGVSLLVTDNGHVAAPLIGSGLIVGGAVGYIAGDRLHVRPGDAAMVNSGALWGTTAGVLLATSFGTGFDRTSAGLTLSGLAMGTAAGVLVTRYFTVSRARAALIDVGGVLGVFVGIAAENIYKQSVSVGGGENERTANFTLGGMAAGLVLAGVLTRNMDEPKIAVTPSVGKVAAADGSSTTTFGVAGAF